MIEITIYVIWMLMGLVTFALVLRALDRDDPADDNVDKYGMLMMATFAGMLWPVTIVIVALHRPMLALFDFLTGRTDDEQT